MRRDRESRFQASHVFTPADQAQAVRLSYKLQFNSRYIIIIIIITTTIFIVL